MKIVQITDIPCYNDDFQYCFRLNPQVRTLIYPFADNFIHIGGPLNLCFRGVNIYEN